MSDSVTDRIDISAYTNALCATLGLEPRLVKCMSIYPSEVSVTVYKTNENGEKYLEDPEEYDSSGFPADDRVALDALEFKVKT